MRERIQGPEEREQEQERKRALQEREERENARLRRMRRRVVPILIVLLALLVCVLVWLMSRVARSDGASDDAGPAAAQDQPKQEQTAAFGGACAALTSATPETIAERWLTMQRTLQPLIDRKLAGGNVAEMTLWFVLPEIERTLIACGIQGEAERALIALLAKNPMLAIVLQRERLAFCVSGGRLAEADTSAPWTEEVRATWRAACAQLLSGSAPAFAGASESKPAATPTDSGAARASSPPTDSTCAGIEELANQRDRVADRSLERDAWMAYGRALAECAPESQPWVQLRLARGREQFVDDYVVPFINGDIARGSWFQNDDRARYGQIASVWLDDG